MKIKINDKISSNDFNIKYNEDIKFENYSNKALREILWINFKIAGTQIQEVLTLLYDKNLTGSIIVSKYLPHNILLYDALYKETFPLLASYYYYNIRKKDISLLVVSNKTHWLEVGLYYNIPTIGYYAEYDMYDEDIINFSNDRVNYLKKLYSNKQIIMENDKSDNKYNSIIVFITSAKVIKTHINFMYYSFNNIIRGLNFLELDGDLMCNFDFCEPKILKQVIYMIGQKFEYVKYSTKKIFTSIGSMCFYIMFKKYKNNNIQDITNLFQQYDKSKVLTNLIDIDYPEDYNMFINKLTDTITYKKYIKLFEKHGLKHLDINNLDENQIQRLANKMFLKNLDYNIILCESVKLQIKEEYKLKNIDYKEHIMEYNLRNTHTLFYKLSEHSININNLSNTQQSISHMFNTLKEELQLMKFYIDTRDIKRWSKTTHIINISRFIPTFIKNKYNMICSRAFIKLYELISVFDLINTTRDLNSLHICELPGNFIAATNHYYRQHNKTNKFNWMGNSLNPHNEQNIIKYGTIFDDHYGFLKKYKSRWLWTDTNTGDITDINTIKYFMHRFSDGVDFFTSDAGLESKTQVEMLYQERKLSILTICQFFIGLLCLKKGRNAVFKVFLPLAEENSISYVKLLSMYFEELIFAKQSSGSAGSSEIYIVAKNKTQDLNIKSIEMLYKHIKHFNNEPLDIEIDLPFKLQLYDIVKKLTDAQIKYLHRSFYYYDNPDILAEHEKYLNAIKYKFVDEWIKMVGFQKLDKHMQL